jgi:hypothetical protein
MITCPWCGTNYEAFQSNCDNCGGSLPLPVETTPVSVEPKPAEEIPLSPPLPPRKIPGKVMRRLLLTDAGMITGGIFLFIGAIFFIVGMALVLAIVTLPVGLPFAGLGLIFLIIGGGLLIWRYENALQIVSILRNGLSSLGQITDVNQNYHVRVNGRYPWVIQYAYKVHGRAYQSRLTTLSQPDLSQQPGKAVYVLYLQEHPDKSTLYPSPYGYFGLDV